MAVLISKDLRTRMLEGLEAGKSAGVQNSVYVLVLLDIKSPAVIPAPVLMPRTISLLSASLFFQKVIDSLARLVGGRPKRIVDVDIALRNTA